MTPPRRPPLRQHLVLAAILSLSLGTQPFARAADHGHDAHAAPKQAPAPAATATPVSEPASAASTATGKAEVSMGELRDLIEHKISEVRASRSVAPVVKVKANGGGGARKHGKAPAEAHGPSKADGHAHWDYQGSEGPARWHELNPEFKLCGLGQRQSPIDIRDGIPVQLDPIQFDYRPSSFRVIDNGHTVQVNVDQGNRIRVNGRSYDLLQFHFHRPSEERLNGRQFDMVVHLVHKNHEGQLAVVAVLLESGSGHPLVQQIWNNLPLEKKIEQPGLQPLDLQQLLPEDRRYLTYMGSLTTPPCSEGVLWMVLKQPVQLSPQQISIFARMYPMNARPIQSDHGRMIKDGQ